MFRFYGLRILKDYLGHIILIGLPVVMISVNTYLATQNGEPQEVVAWYVALVFILMFQVFGGAYAFEGLEHDFYTPFKNRLRAAPVNPVRFILTHLSYSMITGYLQSLVIMLYVVLVYGVSIPNWGLVLLVFLIAVIFAQLLGGVLLMLLKKGNKAQVGITLYAILGTFAGGMFFPLPDTRLTSFLERYSSPLAWSRTAVNAFMASDYTEGLQFLGMVGGITVVAGLLLSHLSRRVII